MQSRAARNASIVASRPIPSGLTMPVATTATRAGFAVFVALELTLMPRVIAFFIPLDLTSDLPYIAARIAVPDDGNCQLKQFSDDLRSDKREQRPSSVSTKTNSDGHETIRRKSFLQYHRNGPPRSLRS